MLINIFPINELHSTFSYVYEDLVVISQRETTVYLGEIPNYFLN
jgi:hypothetical protein